MVWKNSPFVSFTSSCPVFPTPFIEDAISSPSNMHASFVIDWLLHKHGFTSGLYIVREFGIVRRIGSHPSLNVLWNSLLKLSNSAGLLDFLEFVLSLIQFTY